jgi:hypothetical protein
MFYYIYSAYLSIERFLGFGDDDCEDYSDDGYEYLEGNKIVLNTPIIEESIVSPVKIDPIFITSEHTFVAKY